jgi:predicted nucleotidyltransferase
LQQLSKAQHAIVSSLVARLAAIRGVVAVVLGGSHARGRALPGSDVDLGLLYAEADPFSISELRDLAAAVDDTGAPVVTDFFGWGRWVNGGAWLTIGGHRVDFLYRSLDQVERVIADCEAGRYEVDYTQHPPFGFFSGTYLGEVAVAVPLHDPTSRFAALQRRVAVYPEALRAAIVRDHLAAAKFGLGAFARKFAARSDTYGTAACLTRAVNQLVMVLFAVNRRYLVNDKTALAEIGEMTRAPRDFGARVQATLAHLGATSAELLEAVERITRLFRETVDLTEGAVVLRGTG